MTTKQLMFLIIAISLIMAIEAISISYLVLHYQLTDPTGRIVAP